MANVIGEASILVRADVRRFARDAEQGIGTAFRRIAAVAGTVFATIGVGKLFASALKEATDLGEQINKVNVVFGDSAALIRTFGESASAALGQSNRQALEAAGTFGNLFRSLGLAERASADMSVRMVTLASDLASFNNVPIEDALLALRSGLVGETEPLRRFGVNLSEATIRAKALELGLISAGGGTSEFTEEQEKARDALQKVEDSEEKLSDALRDSRRAQQSLTDAREDAVDKLEDLRLAVEGNRLSEQRAAIRLQKAKQRLRESEAKDRAEAILDVKQAELDLKQSRIDSKREREELNEAEQKGVERSDEVVSALERQEDAQEKISDARRDLAKAQAALAKGFKDTTAVLDPAIKAQAAYALIMDQTKLAQGDFARTSGSLANQQRILAAKFADVKAELGQRFIPIALRVVSVLADKLIPVIQTKLGPALGGLINIFVDIVIPVFRDKVIPAIRNVIDIVKELAETFASGLAEGVREFFRAFSGDEAQNAEDSLNANADAAIRFSDVMEAFTEDVAPVIGDVLASLGSVLGTMARGFETFIRTMRRVAVTVQHAVRDFIGAFLAVGAFLYDHVFLPFQGVFNGIATIVRTTVAQAVLVFRTMRDAVAGIMTFIIGLFTLNFAVAIEGFKRALGGIAGFIAGTFGNLSRVLGGLAQIIIGIFAGIVKTIFNIGGAIAEGLFNGIISTIGKLLSKLPGILKKLIPDAIKKFFGVKSPSKLMFGLGENIGEGLSLGIFSGFNFDPSALNMDLVAPNVTGVSAGAGIGRGGVIEQLNIYEASDPRVYVKTIGQELGALATR